MKKWYFLTGINDSIYIHDEYEVAHTLFKKGKYHIFSGGFDTKEELMKEASILEDCSVCHNDFKTSYREFGQQLIDKHICFSCLHWIENLTKENRIIINGTKFSDGGWVDKRTTGGFLGHGGRDFKIEMNDGRIIETNNLMCQGTIPVRFLKNNPDNAKFLKVG